MAFFREDQLDQIAQELMTEGISIRPSLIPSEWSRKARVEIGANREVFREASVGKKRGLHPEIRSDRTQWWDFDRLSPVQRDLAGLFLEIQTGLNQRLFLGLWDLEGHYAIYPAGAFYRTHLDRFANDSARTLSLVLFFNEDWRAEDGGELRVEVKGESVLVAPEAGTLVLFLSDRIPHEVMLTHRERLSFAGWFRQRT